VNPFYANAVIAVTVSALVLKAYDAGKTSSPPANVIGQMLTAAVPSTTASVVVVNTISGAIYDTWLGHRRAGTIEGTVSSST
jgi:hypothetical protein